MYDSAMMMSDWRLCAPVLGAPSFYLVNPSDTNPTEYRIYHTTLFVSLPVLVSSVPIPATNPHFPYGVLVVPD